MEQWAEVRRLHRAEGLGIKVIARRLGLARNTVRSALASDRPPCYEREPTGSVVDGFEARIAEQLRIDPLMPATVIARRVGWTRSASLFRAKVAAMRPLFAGLDPADRTVYKPGHVVQCDLWFPSRPVPVAPGVSAALPVLVMVAAWCGFIMAWMVPTRTTGDLLAGMWKILRDQLGAAPRTLVWDHEAGIGKNRLCDQVASFAGTLGSRVAQVRKGEPEHKGVVERANGFLGTSFEPGRVFTGPDDFNAQLLSWLPTANKRLLRRTGRAPAALIDVDREHMAALPPIAPTTGFSWRGRLGRDYYVRVLGNDYSVDPTVIGRMVVARADLEEVRVVCDGLTVARHPRAWTTRGVFTDEAHRVKASQLRRQRDQLKVEQASQTSLGLGGQAPSRMLSGYDDLFDVNDFGATAKATLGVVQ